MTITDGPWTYEHDDYGDWRGTNAAAGVRTRLKRTLAAAKEDATKGRVQRLIGGEWVDRIDGRTYERTNTRAT